MGFWELLAVASNPIIQVLLVSAVGVYMASDKFDNFLSENFRRSLNKLVFIAFTPSLIFASFARSVSLDDMISWWFMPVNIGCTFVIGGFLGWLIPSLKVEGLIIAACSTGSIASKLYIMILDQVPQSCWQGLVETVSQIVSELLSPPTIATFLGFIFGGVDWLRSLIIGEDAPLRVIQETIQLLGEGTIPCITILLGGNLTQGTMTQLFDAGTEEASVITLWTYSAATISLTLWSTTLLYVLT
ncbi:hypothetical protein Ahy_B10g100356 [Arachis hypogaea]|uniref:Uncharacterized protein n=1 Tax=Arachis hypogaea TaxID=3818 RepID=A0A444WWJ7_ARAHY|nr:hypothetical protein Ahy_B10g100356 [Arachis hypogaea]